MTKLEGPCLERSERAIKHIRNNPERHNQSTWIRPLGVTQTAADRFEAANTTRVPVDINLTEFVADIEEGDQAFSWTCGTTQCYAGQIALDMGAIPIVPEDQLGRTAFYVAYHGRPYSIDLFAAAALDIDRSTCTEAFFGGNSIDDIERVTSHWANGRTEFGRTLIHHPSQCLLGCSECEGIRVIQAHIAEVEAAA